MYRKILLSVNLVRILAENQTTKMNAGKASARGIDKAFASDYNTDFTTIEQLKKLFIKADEYHTAYLLLIKQMNIILHIYCDKAGFTTEYTARKENICISTYYGMNLPHSRK